MSSDQKIPTGICAVHSAANANYPQGQWCCMSGVTEADCNKYGEIAGGRFWTASPNAQMKQKCPVQKWKCQTQRLHWN